MTISYNRLGSNGRLGNQMFQYAGFRGIADNRKYDWVIPPENAETTCNYGLFECFKMTHAQERNKGYGHSNWQTIDSTIFHFDEDLFNNCPDNIELHGYYQSQKYIEKIEKEIREDFKFSDSLLGECKLFFESSFDSEVISLHIRRGDYLNLSHHPVQTLEYYEQSLNQLPQDIPVIIFSNDYDWCKNQKLFEPDRFLMSENNN